MRQVILGRSGLSVSAVGFGGIPIQRVGNDDAVRAIRTALDLGVNLIDTAAGYGDSQKKIGLAVKGRRDGLVLATKSGQKTKEGMLEDVERSRREMGTDVIDLYQFHGVSRREAWDRIRAPGGALEGLLEAREKGWIKHIGFTSHSLDLSLELVEEEIFETIQFPFNLITSEPADALIPRAREKDLGFIVMKPLCGGQFDDAGLAFRFLNGYPGLVAIPGVEAPEEIEEIAAIVAGGETLTGEEKTRAEELAGDLGKLFCRRCGYCQPCPNGVPIQMGLAFDSLVKRLDPEKLASGLAKDLVAGIPECAECGQCQEKCPYELPIIALLKDTLEKARRFVGRHAG